MPNEFIAVETASGVMTITLNRPTVLNSFNTQMARELRAALDESRADNTVRAVMLTGAGRAFCAGQDLSEVPAAKEGEAFDLGATVRATLRYRLCLWGGIVHSIVCEGWAHT